MSQSLTLYVVEIEKARAAIGSRNDTLRRQICGRFKDDIARADEWFESEIEAGAPKRRDAIQAVIAGGPFDDRFGFQYGYAYETIVRHFGRYLNNNHFSPFRGSWLEDVDAGLAALGVSAVKVSSFLYGRVPSPLPRPDDVPGYAEWSQAQCREAFEQWSAAGPERRAGVEAQVLEAIASCAEWMREALARPGSGVAGFGY